MLSNIIFLFLLCALPFSALASSPLSRRDGFLLLWESIRRPAYEVSSVPFEDVREDVEGYLEITYAKDRKFFDEETLFRPGDPLSQEDALLWLFRSRNVEERPDIERSDLDRLLAKYPIAQRRGDAFIESREQLLDFMRSLDTFLNEEVHSVSFYADDFHGQGTAFGETFDMEALTAAHRSFPQDTLVQVTNLENQKSVVVRINDRGPYVDGRDMDLSRAAFERISPISRGVIQATFRRLGDKELVDECSDKPRAYQRRITRDVRFHRGLPHTLSLGDSVYLGSNRYFVVRSITYPDGHTVRIQDFVGPEERFRFVPSISGEYRFIFGTQEGRRREMTMQVSSCSSE